MTNNPDQLPSGDDEKQHDADREIQELNEAYFKVVRQLEQATRQEKAESGEKKK